MLSPSLTDKRTLDKNRMVILTFVGDVLEDLNFKLCRDTLGIFLSHLDEPICGVNR